jgi:hypothetical protein
VIGSDKIIGSVIGSDKIINAASENAPNALNMMARRLTEAPQI